MELRASTQVADRGAYRLKSVPIKIVLKAQANYETVEGRALPSLAETNKTYQAYVAAALMDVQPDFVFGLPARDFTALTLSVQRFLLNLD